MTQRTPSSSPGLPSPERVIELLSADFARAGYEIEDVTVDARRTPPNITVVADGDVPLDLDAVAELSRLASERLDSLDTGDVAYVLEVTSPGVDRPLTAEKHFRRARGRKAELELDDSSTLSGRIGAVTGGAVDVVVRDRGGWSVRSLPLSGIRRAVVQVEFSPPSPQELELAGGGTGMEADT